MRLDGIIVIQPRQYQTEAVESIWNYFTFHSGNPVVVMPTGTGKSIVIALFLQQVFERFPKSKVLVITHVKELIVQNYQKLMEVWPFAPAGVFSAGLRRRDVGADIVFCGIGSVVKRASDFGKVDLVIVDEAHLVSPKDSTMYARFLANLWTVNPALKCIGLTATPYRLGHGLITDSVTIAGKETPGIFSDICFDISGFSAFNRLIAEGFLAPLVPRATTMKLDVSGVPMRGGDFEQGALQIAVNRDELTHKALRESIELAGDRRAWLVFCAGVDHVESTLGAMLDAGLSAVAVHSKMPALERDENIRQFRNGEVQVAVNNNVLTTGFDYPEIDCIIVLRPTTSTVLWVQMLGRGTRPAEGKSNCLVLDFAANTRRLGCVNDPVLPRKKGKSIGTAPVKQCPVCACFVHLSARDCTGLTIDGAQCTHQFDFTTKLNQESANDALIRGEIPEVHTLPVQHVTYALHEKPDRPAMMRVTYYTGLQQFSEYICVEHGGFAGKKARQWWRERSAAPLPGSAIGACNSAQGLKVPTHIRVWVNKKYPEVISAVFGENSTDYDEVPF